MIPAAHVDVLVVGGSYAGMAAALQIARAHRTVAVVDAGRRRNHLAEAAHGFLSQDGRPPDAIAAEARRQLLAYPTVTWRAGTAIAARTTPAGFVIETAEADLLEGKRLVLALGVTDELPDIPGLKARWGKSVFHCPYCHGYELNRGALGVLATGPLSLHQALLIPDWGPTIFFPQGALDIDAEHAAQLNARGVVIDTASVSEIVGERASVRLRDARVRALHGLFTIPRTRPATPLAEHLGCAIEEGPTGSFIQTNAMKETTVPGVFACGDAARPFGSLSLAVAEGAMAGAAAHQSLIFR